MYYRPDRSFLSRMSRIPPTASHFPTLRILHRRLDQPFAYHWLQENINSVQPSWSMNLHVITPAKIGCTRNESAMKLHSLFGILSRVQRYNNASKRVTLLRRLGAHSARPSTPVQIKYYSSSLILLAN